MAQGLKLSDALEVQVLTAYVSGTEDTPAVSATPGWYVAGGFQMPETENVRLEAIGSVSHASLTLRARIFNVTDQAPVDGSTVQLSSKVVARALSGVFELAGGKLYDIEFEVTGNAGNDYFGTLLNAQVINE